MDVRMSADSGRRCSLVASIACWMLPCAAAAQTVLPDVDVRAPQWEQRHGGYLISSNFAVDARMSAVAYPAEPLREGDILAVQLTEMKDDEYFVLQECISDPCTRARIVRAWNAYGALGITAHQDNRVAIDHEGKYFMWMQRFPMSGFSGGPFTGYEAESPPLVLNPTGTAEQFHLCNVKAAQERGPVRVLSSVHDGMSFVLRYEGGTSVLIRRMHAIE